MQALPLPTPAPDHLETTDPPVLVAILIAARKTGDDLLERIVRRELRTRHNLRVQFGNERRKDQ